MSSEIDITDAVEKARETFVDWSTLYLFGAAVAVPGMGWLALPFISSLAKMILHKILEELSQSFVMTAFFFNTTIRKADEAKDFVDAVTAKNSLPDDVSDEDYEKHERAEMVAFLALATIG